MFRIITATFFLFILVKALPSNNVEKLHPYSPIHRNLEYKDSSRIMGGTEAVRGEIPFQVGLILKEPGNNNGFCGGTLVSDTVVVTAAHCVFEYSEFDAIMGTLRVLDENSYGYTVHTTRNKVIHEEFDYDFGLNNDIALLIFDSPITFTETIKPILLPRRKDENEDFVGQFATTSGWGKINDDPGLFLNDDLLHVDVSVLDNYVCEYSFGSAYVPPTKMCLNTHEGSKGACNGDSGGPLYINSSDGEQIFIGIVSFGATQGCEIGYPEVYTRITSFLDWIADHGGPAVRP